MPSIAAGLAYNMLFLWEVPDSVAESFAAQVRAATDGAAPNIVAQVRDYITARVDASGAKLKVRADVFVIFATLTASAVT